MTILAVASPARFALCQYARHLCVACTFLNTPCARPYAGDGKRGTSHPMTLPTCNLLILLHKTSHSDFSKDGNEFFFNLQLTYKKL